MTKPVEIRAPRSDELRALARLKIEWAGIDPQPDKAAEWAYADDLAAWMDRMGDRALCRVAVSGGELIGMAWLVVFERVPDFSRPQAAHGRHAERLRGADPARARRRPALIVGDLRGGGPARHPATDGALEQPGMPLYEDAGFHQAPTLLDRRSRAA